MRFHTLGEWLAFQEKLHPVTIDMGLDRVREVATRMSLLPAACPVITVGGTNGKGSTVAFLAAMLRAAGHKVGVYTSPHLVNYNERVVIDGVPASDASLCAAFDTVDRAREDTSITYFEFGTLAAMHCFRDAACDLVVLEVGMGGRLDATNIWDAAAAAVVSIGLDHTEWLGPDRESIGFEKAGIYRAGKPAICADPHPPASLVAHIQSINAHPIMVGEQYRYVTNGQGGWRFEGPQSGYDDLPPPALAGIHQTGNAAAALAVLDALPQLFPVNHAAVVQGLRNAQVNGRLQRLREAPEIIVDVTHNAEGARVLARHLSSHPVGGRTIAVCGMMADKPVVATMQALDHEIMHWVLGGLPGPRGADAATLGRLAFEAGIRGTFETCPDIESAIERAVSLAQVDDRVLVFGSFLTVAAALQRVV